MSCAKSSGRSSRPSRRMARSVTGPVTCPTGAARFCARSAVTTWSTPTPAAVSRAGSSTTFSVALSAPATFTCATPAMARSSPPTTWSPIWVSCAGVRVSEVSASETIGCCAGSKRWTIGSTISVGSCARTAEIASRTSWVASSVGLSNLNWTMIWAKPSLDVEVSWSSLDGRRDRFTRIREEPSEGWATGAPGVMGLPPSRGVQTGGNAETTDDAETAGSAPSGSRCLALLAGNSRPVSSREHPHARRAHEHDDAERRPAERVGEEAVGLVAHDARRIADVHDEEDERDRDETVQDLAEHQRTDWVHAEQVAEHGEGDAGHDHAVELPGAARTS